MIRKLLLSVVTLTLAVSAGANAQERFFTLSGGSRGDTANAKHESQISELKARNAAYARCAARGMFYAISDNGDSHPKADSQGCVTSFVVAQDGVVSFESDIEVAKDVKINGKAVQYHALVDAVSCREDEKLQWSGTAWRCEEEADPKIGTLKSGKWCAEQNGKIVCNKDAPSTETDIEPVLDGIIANEVRDFARKAGSLASCQGGEVLIADGSTLTCKSLDGIARGTLILDDLSDVEAGLPANDDLLYFNGTNWASGAVVRPFSKRVIDNKNTDGRCAVGDVITYDGDKLVCIPDIGGPGNALALGDLADVTGTADATATNILVFSGTEWTPGAELDGSVSPWAKLDRPIANQVSDQCDPGYMLTYDGTQLSCVPDVGGAGAPLFLTDLGDVSLTAPVSNSILKFSGSVWEEAFETDPNVQAFARVENPIPNCSANYLLTSDGTNLSCVADAGSVANGLSIDDLTDVSLTSPTTHDMLVWDGSGFVNKGSASCAADEVLQYDGSSFSCVKVTDLGLWTDNVTYITRQGFHVVNDSEALPAAVTGAGKRALWYPNKTAFRVGEVSGAEWDDVNIGQHSVALGQDVAASGANSLAFGQNVTVSGNNSVAIGLGSVATLSDANTFAVVGGNVGVGTVSPNAALDVSGSIILGNGGESCNAALEGALQYDLGGTHLQYCDGSTWQQLANDSSVVKSLSDLSDVTLSAPSASHTLIYNGSEFVNQQLSLNDLSDAYSDNNNIGLGLGALSGLTSGSNNIAIGANVDVANATGSDQLNIANIILGDMAGESVDVSGTFGASGDATIGGTLTVLGSLNVSGTQSIDGVVFANGGIQATGNISATTFTGDGSGLTGVVAASADWYGLTNIPTGVDAISNTALETAELTQLQNIDGTTISAAQFGYLGDLDQGLSTTDNVQFAGVSATDIHATGNVSATTFTGDGSGLTGVTAASADWYGLTNVPAGVDAISNTALDTAELTQLQNIDGTTISAAQFGYLGNLDQGLSTTDSVQFADVSATGDVYVSGNVGIGTSVPLAELDVSGSIVASGTVSGDEPTLAGHLTTKSYVDSALAGLSQNQITQGDTSATVTDSGVGEFAVDVDGGRVATFTTSNLHVDGNIWAGREAGWTSGGVYSYHNDNNPWSTGFFGRKSRSGATVQDGDEISKFVGQGYDGDTFETATTIKHIVDGTPSDGRIPGSIRFGTSNALGQHYERMRITSDGNVGIGTSDPSSTLHVGGVSTFHGQGNYALGWGNTSTVGRLTYDANGPIIQSTGAGNKLRLSSADDIILAGGNVGIGTDSPSGKFHVAQSDSGIETDFMTTTQSLVLRSAYDLSSAGEARLDFQRSRGTAAAPTVAVNDDVISQILGRAYDGTDFERVAAIRMRADGVVSNNDAPGRLEFYTTPDGSNVEALQMVIKNDGRVGLGGIATPSAELDVSGSIVASGTVSAAVPTLAGHLATKGYVDSALAGNSTQLTQGDTSATVVDSGTGEFAVDVDGARTATFASGKVNVGGSAVDATTHAALDVEGTVKIAGNNSEACDANNVGVIRFNSATGRMQICRP